MPFASLDSFPPRIVEPFRPTASQRRLAAAAAGLAVHYTVQELCAAAQISPASYYRWQHHPGFAAWWMAETWNCLRASAPLLVLSTMQFALGGDAAARKLLFQYLVAPPSAPGQPSGPPAAPGPALPPASAAAAPARPAHPAAAAPPSAAAPLPLAAGLPLGGRAAEPPPPRSRLARPSGVSRLGPPATSRLGPVVLRVAGAAPRSGGSRRAVRLWPHGHA
jgi:hypothetical protein